MTVDKDKIFTYHEPFEETAKRYQEIRTLAKMFSDLVDNLVPKSREASLAQTKIEEAVMWANAGIARNITKEALKVHLINKVMKDNRANNSRPRVKLQLTDDEIWELYCTQKTNYRQLAMLAGCSKDTIMRIIQRMPDYIRIYWSHK